MNPKIIQDGTKVFIALVLAAIGTAVKKYGPEVLKKILKK